MKQLPNKIIIIPNEQHLLNVFTCIAHKLLLYLYHSKFNQYTING